MRPERGCGNPPNRPITCDVSTLHGTRPVICVILPAWNEAELIHPTLLALVYAMHASGEAYHAVLVDDGSTDATIAEAERAVTDSGGRLSLTVLRDGTNRGLGAGLRTGLEWCLDRASYSITSTPFATFRITPAASAPIAARCSNARDGSTVMSCAQLAGSKR